MGLRLLRKARDLKESIVSGGGDRRDFLLKKLPKNSICAEVGVWKGTLSKRIIKLTKPKRLILIDAWASDMMHDNSDVQNLTQNDFDLLYSNVLKKFSDNDEVEIIRKNSKEAVKIFPDEYFDWIYIDASHHYEDVLQDLELARLKVKKGGIIAGDDYINAVGKWGLDVIKAVDNFAKKYGLHVESINNQFIIKLP